MQNLKKEVRGMKWGSGASVCGVKLQGCSQTCTVV